MTWKEAVFSCHFLLSGIWQYSNQLTIDTWHLNTLPGCSSGPRELGFLWSVDRKRLFDRCLSENRIFRIIDRAVHKECPHHSKFGALERLC